MYPVQAFALKLMRNPKMAPFKRSEYIMRNNPPYFAVEIDTAGYIPHCLLFEEKIKESLDDAGFGGSHIYYLTRTPKLRFIPSTASLTKDYVLNVDIEIGGNRTQSTSLPIASLPPFSFMSPDKLHSFQPNIYKKELSAQNLALKGTYKGQEYSMPIPLLTYLACQDIDF